MSCTDVDEMPRCVDRCLDGGLARRASAVSLPDGQPTVRRKVGAGRVSERGRALSLLFCDLGYTDLRRSLLRVVRARIQKCDARLDLER